MWATISVDMPPSKARISRAETIMIWPPLPMACSRASLLMYPIQPLAVQTSFVQHFMKMACSTSAGPLVLRTSSAPLVCRQHEIQSRLHLQSWLVCFRLGVPWSWSFSPRPRLFSSGSNRACPESCRGGQETFLRVVVTCFGFSRKNLK